MSIAHRHTPKQVTQTNISANMEIKEQKLGQHEFVFDTSMRNTLQIR